MPRERAAGQPLRADIDGFSLHAAVRVEAHDRKRLDQLRRYISRPALSDERVQVNVRLDRVPPQTRHPLP
jgi:Putative transposase